MSNDVYATVTKDQREELVNLVRRLPSILAGRAPDENGLASGFRARIGHTVLSLIQPNFNDLGRGHAGADGDKWPPLTRAYLAYGRRFGPGEQSNLKKAAGLGKNASLAPNNQKGLLTPDQLKLWKRTFTEMYAWYVMKESDKSAKAHAAAVAWIVVKKAGGKTKLEAYGNRQVQMLVDTGRLRNSLQPGELMENGPDAVYSRPTGEGGQEQEFEIAEPSRVVVGSNVEYARHHHAAKSLKRRRRLWPERFPYEWWQEILGTALQGLVHLKDAFERNNR